MFSGKITTFDKTNKVLFYLYLSSLVLFLLSIFSGYILTNASGNLYRKTLDKYLEHLAEVKTGCKKKSNLIVSSGWFHGVIFYIFEIGTYLALITLAAFTVIKQLMRPHSLHRSVTVNMPADRQMPIVSVVGSNPKNEKIH